MYSGTRTVKLKKGPTSEEYRPDLSSTSAARRSLKYARKNYKPEVAEKVESAVAEAFPDILISRSR